MNQSRLILLTEEEQEIFDEFNKITDKDQYEQDLESLIESGEYENLVRYLKQDGKFLDNKEVKKELSFKDRMIQSYNILTKKEEKNIDDKVKKIDNIEAEYLSQIETEFKNEIKNIKVDDSLIKQYQYQLQKMVKIEVQKSMVNFIQNSAFDYMNSTDSYFKEDFLSFITQKLKTLEESDEKEYKQIIFNCKIEFSELLNIKQKEFESAIDQLKKDEQYFYSVSNAFFQEVMRAELMGTKTFITYSHLEESLKKSKNQNFKDQIIKFNVLYEDFDHLTKELEENTVFRQHQLYSISNSQITQRQVDSKYIQSINIKNYPQSLKHQQWFEKQFQDYKIWWQQNQRYKKSSMDDDINKLRVLILQKNGIIAFIQIKQKIIDCCDRIEKQQRPNITFIQSILRNIDDCIQKNEKEFLSKELINFKKFGFFEQIVMDALLYSINQNYINEQISQLQEKKEKYNENMINYKSILGEKIETYLGDHHTAVFIANRIKKEQEEKLKTVINNQYYKNLASQSKMKPDILLQQGDIKVIEQTVSNDEFLEWSIDISKYLEKIYYIHFDSVKSQIKENIISEFKQNNQKLQSKIQKIQEVFPHITIVTGEQKSQNNTQLNQLKFKLILSFLTDAKDVSALSKQINELSDGQINFEQYSQNIEGNVQSMEELFGQEFKILFDDGKIEDPKYFLQQLLEKLKESDQNQILDDKYLDEKRINQIKENNYSDAIGCKEVCPYCGAKCNIQTINNNHDGNHSTNSHRVMGLRGSHYKKNNQIQLLEYCCSSQDAQKTKWFNIPGYQALNSKESLKAKYRESLDPNIKQILQQNNCVMGKLNFTLEWSDPNDLDLYVTCPCNIRVGRGNKTLCQCEGESDLDMNFIGKQDAYHPAEHITYKNPKEGKYQIKVWYYDQKTIGSVVGGLQSKFKIYVHEQNGEILQMWDGFVSKIHDSFIQQYIFQPDSNKIYFQEHLKRYYSNWTIVEGKIADHKLITTCGNQIKKEDKKQMIMKATYIN